MATIVKRGDSYTITVSSGRDIDGKKMRKYMTWTPKPGMTERQIEKELQRQAVLFEEKVHGGYAADGSTRFADFVDIFNRDYMPGLKPKTQHDYKQMLAPALQALGHIKLRDLRPAHISAYLRQLEKRGSVSADSAVFRGDFGAVLKERKTSMTGFSKSADVSMSAVKRTKAGQGISVLNAEKIAHALGFPVRDIFNIDDAVRPLSPSTLRSHFRTLSAVLGMAEQWEYIDSNPCRKVKAPGGASPEASVLDTDGAKRLLVALQDEPIQWRAPIMFALLSGLRRGELLGLSRADVNIDAQTVTVRRTVSYTPERGIYFDTPKSKESIRTIRVTRAAIAIIEEAERWQKDNEVEAQNGLVFVSAAGAPIHPDALSRWFRDFANRAGFPNIKIHTLRHTYATLLIEDGAPLALVSRQLGHAQTSTTANIYAHAVASAEAKMMATLDSLSDAIECRAADADDKRTTNDNSEEKAQNVV